MTSGMATMNARYPGICKACRNPIAVGQAINYEPGNVTHVRCADPGISPRVTRRPVSKCPNPSDCGDPTCQGDCGYG